MYFLYIFSRQCTKDDTAFDGEKMYYQNEIMVSEIASPVY